MKLRVRQVERFERRVVFRSPFRFGVVTLREAPQLFLRARIELEDGRTGWGCAAELLSAKWFDKNPRLSNEENFEQLRQSVGQAVEIYLSEREYRTAFDLFAVHYRPQLDACSQRGLNALIASYGPALLDRAVLDALCRLLGVSFYEAIRNNLPGIRAIPDTPDLAGFDVAAFLASLANRNRLHVRHTIGLSDALSRSDQSSTQRLDDGLPETLEEVIKTYGNTFFKVKVCGDLTQDLPRLRTIANLLDQIPEAYFVTLDGNEQYASIDGFNELLASIGEERKLERFVSSLLFIEQPFGRDMALRLNAADLDSPLPVIIDESDDSLEAFPRARAAGYRGVSSKACKGFYKSLLNAARCALWNQDREPARYFMSAEDLTVQPGISWQQDLAIVALLGLEHAERNGHHYVNGMAGLPEEEQAAFLSAHADLYHRSSGAVRVRIERGQMHLASLNCPGFAAAAEPNWSTFPR